jgi:sugar lactone lactonase YvrE
MLVTMQSRWVVLACCCAGFAWGCSDGIDSGGNAADSGPSGDVISTSDTGSDAAPGTDAAGDAPVDTGHVGHDGASDGGVDSTISDGSSMDVATDSTMDSTTADTGPADSGSTPEDGGDGGDGGNDAGDASIPVSITYETGITVSTLAGNGAYADVDGLDASFKNPTGIALFGSGIIVVENDTGKIRTVSATGDTKTIATSPVQKAQTSPFTIVAAPTGYYYSTDFDQHGLHVDGGGGVWSFSPDDAGSGTSSLILGGLTVPRTLVPLPGGDLFVFDTAVSSWTPVTEMVAERLATAGPTVTLIAGHAGSAGFANGDGGAALFGSPTVGGVLLPDGSGVVVGDCGNHQLRLVGLDGTVSTYAGSTSAGWVDGPLATALFQCPHALAIDSAGNIYVSDWNNNAIRRISSGGNVTTIAGTGWQGWADGPGQVAQFYGAEGMVVSADGSTLYVADGNAGKIAVPYNRIRAITLPALDGG